jgi:integrase
MAEEITDQLVAAIQPRFDGAPSIIVYDGLHKKAVPGFGLRVTKGGARSFVLEYRVRGKGMKRRYTIGPASIAGSSGWKTGAARKRAEELRKLIAVGGDPAGKLRAERDAPTLRDLATRYLEEHASVYKRPRSRKEDESLLDQIILPELGNRVVADITKEDVARLHRKVTTKGFPARRWATREELAQGDLFERPAPSRRDPARLRKREPRPAPKRANRAVALLSKMFNLAIDWEMRRDNPTARITKNIEEPRAVYLSLEEIAKISAELTKRANQPSANAVRLLLLTGARRGEILSASWPQFDLEAGIWTKPSAHTKQKKEHRVPLSAPARLLLVEMKTAAAAAAKKEKRPPGPMLFPGRGTTKPQTELKRFWETVCKDAKISAVRLHDLRHTYASVLASAGLSLPIIGQLLGHTQAATTQRYAHLFDDPLRRATERAAEVIAPDDKKKTAEVYRLRTGEAT